MKVKFAAELGIKVLVLCCILFTKSIAQESQIPTLQIGDVAPPIKVSLWLKGKPIKKFKKGKVYILEFWATWCRPCIAAMPHLSEIAHQYRKEIETIGINVYDTKTPIEDIIRFMKTIGKKMVYRVALDSGKFMETCWAKASGIEGGIPKTIIVDKEGIVAWIGHPKNIDSVIPQILNDTWNLNEVSSERNFYKYLKALDDSMNFELMQFRGNYDRNPADIMPGRTDSFEQDDIGKPDTALFYIAKIIKQEPNLQFWPLTTFNTIYSLLKTDVKQAYMYGMQALNTPTPTEKPCHTIIGAIEICSYKLSLPPQIYELGAIAYQVEIDQFYYPELAAIPRYYHSMAWWYWLAKDKWKAIKAEENAIKVLKSRESTLPSQLAVYSAQLEFYKTCAVDD